MSQNLARVFDNRLQVYTSFQPYSSNRLMTKKQHKFAESVVFLENSLFHSFFFLILFLFKLFQFLFYRSRLCLFLHRSTNYNHICLHMFNYRLHQLFGFFDLLLICRRQSCALHRSGEFTPNGKLRDWSGKTWSSLQSIERMLSLMMIHFDSETKKLSVFQYSKEATIKTIFETMLKPKLSELPKTRVDGLKEVCRNPNYAFLTVYELGVASGQAAGCAFYALPKPFSRTWMALATVQDSPFYELLNYK